MSLPRQAAATALIALLAVAVPAVAHMTPAMTQDLASSGTTDVNDDDTHW